MPSIIRPSRLVEDEDAVAIPDIEFKPPEIVPDKQAVINGFDMSDFTEEQRERVAEFLNGQIRKITDKYSKESDIRQQKAVVEAEKEAQRIIEETEQRREEILNHAKAQSAEICDRARTQGMHEGQKLKAEEIEKTLSELCETLCEMKELQQKRFDEFYYEIKDFACDVASRLVYKKIDEDDLYLRELVLAAVKEAKESEWVTVELSSRLGALAESLEKELKESGRDIDFETSPDADAGKVLVNASDRRINASISEQLKNIKHYFETFGEGDEENR